MFNANYETDYAKTVKKWGKAIYIIGIVLISLSILAALIVLGINEYLWLTALIILGAGIFVGIGSIIFNLFGIYIISYFFKIVNKKRKFFSFYSHEIFYKSEGW